MPTLISTLIISLQQIALYAREHQWELWFTAFLAVFGGASIWNTQAQAAFDLACSRGIIDLKLAFTTLSTMLMGTSIQGQDCDSVPKRVANHINVSFIKIASIRDLIVTQRLSIINGWSLYYSWKSDIAQECALVLIAWLVGSMLSRTKWFHNASRATFGRMSNGEVTFLAGECFSLVEENGA